MIICRLVASLAVVLLALHAGRAAAQGVWPEWVPDQSAVPPNATPFPQGGAAPLIAGGFGAPPVSDRSEACAKGFASLREEAEKRGKLIKAASDRKAPPDEACKLIIGFGDAEIKMIKYVENNAAKCGIQQQIADQLKAAHRNTDALLQKVCRVAQQMQSPHGPVHINDIGDPAMEDQYLFEVLPPSKKLGPTRLQ